jgi:hypothetical protein
MAYQPSEQDVHSKKKGASVLHKDIVRTCHEFTSGTGNVKKIVDKRGKRQSGASPCPQSGQKSSQAWQGLLKVRNNGSYAIADAPLRARGCQTAWRIGEATSEARQRRRNM